MVLLSAKSSWKKAYAKSSSQIAQAIKENRALISIVHQGENLWIGIVPDGNKSADKEKLRNLGHSLITRANSEGLSSVSIENNGSNKNGSLEVLEGILLSSYQFLAHKSDSKKHTSSMKTVEFVNDNSSIKDMKEVENTIEAVAWARDLVNHPFSHMTATDLANSFKKESKNYGYSLEVFGKKKIESLKMGGLLAVNKGSIDPPTFSILEWKPKKPVNSKPIVLVGKGVVYDTGGLSLKPTANSMDFMKSDMAGSAMMAATVAAVAKNKLDIHVIALVPATDNRPSGNAYAPGDVITMFDGTTVEVMNTDAEGRLLLADALSYAKKFEPSLVMDAATLTGAAVRSVGTHASCIMSTCTDNTTKELQKSGEATYERVIEFPLWDEYGKELKSEIADMTNLGGPYAGQITAGKFLEHFTDYPWVHIDIAGPSFLHTPQTYRPKGGTGVGVRLLYDFLKNMTK